VQALGDKDVAVRQAAGEGAALLYSQSGLAADRDSPSTSGWAHLPPCPSLSKELSEGLRLMLLQDSSQTKGLGSDAGCVSSIAQPRGYLHLCSPGSPAAEAANGGGAGAATAGMDEVVARMRELATHRGDEQRRNRRDRAALKSTFRDLVTTVEVRAVQGGLRAATPASHNGVERSG
jgi:Interferon-related developmental regulator (IFRD)